MTPKNIFIARHEELVVQKLESEVLVYDLRNSKMFCLNETSASVYELCDGANSVTDIARKLSREFKQTVPEGLIWLAIEQLKENELLAGSLKTKTKYEGLSRREVIRKVGFASLVALPVVTSITAPQAVTASSVCGRTCTVTVPFGNTCGLPQGCAGSNYLGYDVSGCDNSCMYCECTVSIFAQSCTSTCRATSQYQ